MRVNAHLLAWFPVIFQIACRIKFHLRIHSRYRIETVAPWALPSGLLLAITFFLRHGMFAHSRHEVLDALSRKEVAAAGLQGIRFKLRDRFRGYDVMHVGNQKIISFGTAGDDHVAGVAIPFNSVLLNVNDFYTDTPPKV